LEIWRVVLENRSRRRRGLDLTSALEWNLGPAPDTHREFHRLFIETEYVAGDHALLATKRLNTIAEHGRGQPWNVEWPHVAFHAMSARPTGWESDKRRFFGLWGSTARQAAVLAGRLSGLTGKWLDGMAALQTRVVLAPGARREIVFTLGLAESRTAARRLARKYRSPAAVERAWRAMRAHWDRLLA